MHTIVSTTVTTVNSLMKLDTVLIKVASRCNINCSYCYVYNMGDSGWTEMPTQISSETIATIAQALSDFSVTEKHSFAVVLHGGEPLLLGAVKLRDVLKTLRAKLPKDCQIGLQTNGILITEEILDICSETRTTVSVSIDGPRRIHDKDRVGHNGQGTYEKVIKGLEILRSHKDADFLYSGLLTVINPQSDPLEIYQFLKKLSPPSVDFLYRDGNHSKLPTGKASFSSTEYGSWLVRLLEIYLSDAKPLAIRFLDDIIKLVLGGFGTKDGVVLTDYGVLVIDTDGSIAKNDTLKSAFNGADRFIQNWSVFTHSLSEVFNSDEYAEYHATQQPSSPICLSCPELQVCGGGMTLHRWRDDNGYDNPSVYCADQKLLIGQVRQKLAKMQADL